MLRLMCAAALVSAALLSGCSGQRTLDQEKLKSAATEIESIASEGALLAAAVVEHHASANYAKGAPEYLRKQAEDVSKELKQGRPAAHVQHRLESLRDAAERLMDALNALPANRDDPRWQQSRAQLDNIRQQAEEVRRTF